MFCGDAPDLLDHHVLLFHGYDLTHAGQMSPCIPPCPFCVALGNWPGSETILTDDEQNGRIYHYVICGTCGATGPDASTESEALARWSAASGEKSCA